MIDLTVPHVTIGILPELFLQSERAMIVTTCPRNAHDDFKIEFDWHKRTRQRNKLGEENMQKKARHRSSTPQDVSVDVFAIIVINKTRNEIACLSSIEGVLKCFFRAKKGFLFVGHNHIEVLLSGESNSDNKKQNLFWKIL